MIKSASQVSTRSTGPSVPRSFMARPLAALATIIALAGVAAWLPGAALADSVPTNCDKVASPAGSDSNAGSAGAPLRSAQALTNALAPGQVGCLRAGTYPGGLRLNHGGKAGAPLVLRSYPGEQALITGRVYVPQGSDYVTIGDLSLDGNYQSGRPLPSPTVAANHTVFESDDVTNDHTEICFDIGSSGWGIADSTVLAGNHIHDCGLLPSRNEDHGIYVQAATNTRIVGNLIDHNTDRGIQLYPSAQGTVVTGNVISNNGEGIAFGGDEGVASNNSTVEHNLIVNSDIRGDVESWYPAGNPHGSANIVQNNCVSTRGINLYDGGFVARNNVTASAAELVAGANGGYLPATGSRCASIVPELASVQGAEGTPSGGGPNSAGKAEGGGTTPAPEHEGPAGSTSGTPAGGTPGAGTVHAVHANRARHARRAAKARHGKKRTAHARSSARRRAQAKRASSARRHGA